MWKWFEFGKSKESYFNSVYSVIDNFIVDLIGDTSENPDISYLKRLYFDKHAVKLNSIQLYALNELNKVLREIEKNKISELTPESFFANDDWQDGYEPNTPLYALKSRLQELLDLLNWLSESAAPRIAIESTFLETIDLVADKIEIINTLIAKEAKFTFSVKLRNLADKANLKQQDIAKKLQVRQQTVSDWYCANSIPSIERAIQLAILLGTSVDYLVRPDVRETNISNDFITKETGLSSETVEKLKYLHEHNQYRAKELSFILNLLISKVGNGSDTDLFLQIAEFLKPQYEQSVYAITEEDFEILRENIYECQTIGEVKTALREYISNIESESSNTPHTALDISNLQLMNINKVLTRLKDEITKKSI